jgi:hypothetical protein
MVCIRFRSLEHLVCTTGLQLYMIHKNCQVVLDIALIGFDIELIGLDEVQINTI